jgi:hypothetical protein
MRSRTGTRGFTRDGSDRRPIGDESYDGVDALNATDVVIVQHEYGIYDGPDGDAVLGLIRHRSSFPSY